ncbi:MAG: UDP-N-acetylmuramate--L-alanine ligase [Oscillospiraceae bacterium]|nr:UDP-N-acetylmuramate--L-alanine ligase [Oscillospiraceae bacterium]
MCFDVDSCLRGAKHVHFIGIGGSGMCPLAELLLSEGKKITGSDMDGESDTVARLRRLGAEIAVGQRAENITSQDPAPGLVVYTAALQKDNPELLAALGSGIPTIERAVLMGAVCRRCERTIAVCGTHGKTTATSMISQILLGANLDPSLLIGGRLPLIDAYSKAGGGVMVVEACEFADHFLQITPACAVILNIDADHLEHFGSVGGIIKSFNKFAKQTSQLIIVNGDDANSLAALSDVNLKIIRFGLGDGNDYQAKNLVKGQGGLWKFDMYKNGGFWMEIQLGVPGRHNVLNALAAAAAADYAGAAAGDIARGLSEFAGACRRFEIHTRTNGITIADDYAHHPAELEATLRAAMDMEYNRVWAIFQPFTYSRTKEHLGEFARVLQIADRCLLTEIMAAREVDDLGVSSSQLRALIPGAELLPSFESIADYALANARPGDLLITMGCGDIYKCAKIMTNKLTCDRHDHRRDRHGHRGSRQGRA